MGCKPEFRLHDTGNKRLGWLPQNTVGAQSASLISPVSPGEKGRTAIRRRNPITAPGRRYAFPPDPDKGTVALSLQY